MAVIYGTIEPDIINGAATNDTIYGWDLDGNANSPSGNDILFGNVGDDNLNGGTDDDTLDGGSGTDALSGGIGNDIYVVDSITDTITEYFNEEIVYDDFGDVIGSIDVDIDTVQSSISYRLGSNLENLTFTGNGAIEGTGNALDNTLIGNVGNNSLYGGRGNDALDGGLGSDALFGGRGDDFYIYNTTDTIVEYFDQGADFVESSVSYTLGGNLENLRLTGLSDII